jgi:putative hemolysin
LAALELIVVAVLILFNGYLAMCELAIVSSRRSQLERRAGGGDSGARAALILANDPARFLASLQIGITTVAVLTGTFSGATLAHRLDDWLDLFPAISSYSKPVAFVLIVVSVTFLSLLFGELVPKQIALKNPEALAIRLARPLVAFTQIAAPLVWVLNASANLVLRIFGIRAGFERHLTDEDIAGVLIEGEKSGLIHAAEREMIEDVLDLADRPVNAIMTPRPDVVWINIDGPEAAQSVNAPTRNFLYVEGHWTTLRASCESRTCSINHSTAVHSTSRNPCSLLLLSPSEPQSCERWKSSAKLRLIPR